ncbi:putative transcriptional regulator [Clostridium amylolyticum]|uniref:Putative transcriptional regulator n=1 Tax=Clostridium amylolyticum TaxID=1121298 RepID=A0A1M6L2U3_9CLOT|nr:helix-turn-helix transcriptional regulator [Clostridium amylolyticum]SHJ65503.1 putative transcriptional regulator [Clostridium amylolyticum]
MTKLREVRKNVGLERKYVAEKLGISPDHLSLLERGKTPLNVIKVEILAGLYNKTFEEIAIAALETAKGGEKC